MFLKERTSENIVRRLEKKRTSFPLRFGCVCVGSTQNPAGVAVSGMRLLDTGLRTFGVLYIVGFRIICRGVIWYMPLQCVLLPPPEAVVMIRYGPGFDY